MNEIWPIACGLLMGSLLSLVRPALRIPIGALLAVTFGVLATLISGEFLISWAFLLIDIPLVAVSAIAGLFGMLRLRAARAGRTNRQA